MTDLGLTFDCTRFKLWFIFQAFKAEWEALEVTEHSWALKNSEQEMMTQLGPTNDNVHHQIQRN